MSQYHPGFLHVSFLQSPKDWLLDRVNRLSIHHKILAGHLVMLSVAATGTILGVLWGINESQQVNRRVEVSHLNISAISNLYSALDRVLKNHDELLLLNPKNPTYKVRQRLIHEEVIQANTYLTNLRALSPARSIPGLQTLLKTYGTDTRQYLERLDLALGQLRTTSPGSSRFKGAQQSLNRVLKSPELQSAILLQLKLDSIQVSAQRAERLAWEQLTEFSNIQWWIVLGSLIISLGLGLVLAQMIGRAIAAPLLAVNRTTQTITQEANFSLPIPITTQDEVGELAISISQLVSQIQALLLEQQANAEAQLIQSEKMASLGRMLAGIAHDINNPIGFAHGNLSHLESYLYDIVNLLQQYQHYYPTPPEPINEAIESINLAFILEDLPKLLTSMQLGLNKTRQIISSLKDFSRLDSRTPHPVNLESCLASTLVILQDRLNAVQLETSYQTVPEVEGYTGLLYQVFANLVGNAVDALQGIGVVDEVSESSIANRGSIAARKSHLKASAEAVQPTIWISIQHRSDAYVEIVIRDNGPGIPPQVKDHIFKTFFTTKPRNAGTGLGLAISNQIVTEKHHGHLICESQPGQGTQFTVVLPVKQPVERVSDHSVAQMFASRVA